MCLYRANVGVLDQKLQLLSTLESNFKEGASMAFASECPLVGDSSIGQHYRHSLDHMALPIKSIGDRCDGVECDFHYDLRTRGGSFETDINASRSRILELKGTIEDCIEKVDDEIGSSSTGISDQDVRVHFMLDNEGHEFRFKSNIEREMHFAMHHAIHHLAIVKIIAINHLGLHLDSLPEGFGKAPSTQKFDSESNMQGVISKG